MTAPLPTPAELLADPWACGPFCWVISEVRLLATPMAARGMQGLWPVAPYQRPPLEALAGGPVAGALTVLEPYASAIARGPKRIENRSWSRSLSDGGMWVGLHAGKQLYDNAGLLLQVWRRPSAEHHLWPEQPLWSEAPRVDQLHRGVLLGVMHVRIILPYPKRGAGVAPGSAP